MVMIYLGVEVDCDALERLLARGGIDATASYRYANRGKLMETDIKRELLVSVPAGTPADTVNAAVTRLEM